MRIDSTRVDDNDVTFLYLQNAYERTSYQRGLFLIFALKITSLDPVVLSVSLLSHFVFSISIFAARRSYARAVLGVVILSVCPSLCPSVTQVPCD